MLTKLATEQIDILLVDLPEEDTHALIISTSTGTPFEEAITLILNDAQVKHLREILPEGGKQIEEAKTQRITNRYDSPGAPTQAE